MKFVNALRRVKMNRVVITGIGVVSPVGNNLNDFWLVNNIWRSIIITIVTNNNDTIQQAHTGNPIYL